MKYLKKFEDNENQFFTEITKGEFHNSKEFACDIKDEFIEKITSLAKDKKISREIEIGEYTSFYFIHINYPGNNTVFFVDIYESKDEWFFVNIESLQSTIDVYYKCDQFEGLLKLLSDYGVIKK